MEEGTQGKGRDQGKGGKGKEKGKIEKGSKRGDGKVQGPIPALLFSTSSPAKEKNQVPGDSILHPWNLCLDSPRQRSVESINQSINQYIYNAPWYRGACYSADYAEAK